MKHVLKCWPEEFDAIAAGDKTFEYRLNDRDYHVGDTLVLRRFDSKIPSYTGEVLHRTVTYVLRDGFGLPEGYCVLAIKPAI